MTVEIWANHVRIKRPRHTVPTKPTKRGKINKFSPRAARRLRWAVENTPDLMARGTLFVCLTYPTEWPKDGREVKKHLDTFGKRARRLGAFFAWVLEYQKRGAPHFHLLARFPETMDTHSVREWVAQNWFEVVGSGDEKHLRAGTSVEVVRTPECAGWYVSNYLGKEYQKTPPEGVTLPGRMWGMIGCKTPDPETLRFPEGSRTGIELARLIRRWAASDYAFRQRWRIVSTEERLFDADSVEEYDPQFARYLRDMKHNVFTSEVLPDFRKAWSPRDPGREKGFSVRNGAKISRQLLETNTPPF